MTNNRIVNPVAAIDDGATATAVRDTPLGQRPRSPHPLPRLRKAATSPKKEWVRVSVTAGFHPSATTPCQLSTGSVRRPRNRACGWAPDVRAEIRDSYQRQHARAEGLTAARRSRLTPM